MKGRSLKTKVLILGLPLGLVFALFMLFLAGALLELRRVTHEVEHSTAQTLVVGKLAKAASAYERNYWDLLASGDQDEARQIDDAADEFQRALDEAIREGKDHRRSDDTSRLTMIASQFSGSRTVIAEIEPYLINHHLTGAQLISARKQGLANAELKMSCGELASREELELERVLSKLEASSRFTQWLGHSLQRVAQDASVQASGVAAAQRAERKISAELATLTQYLLISRRDGPGSANFYSVWAQHMDTDEALESLQRAVNTDAQDVIGRQSVARIIQRHQDLHELTRQATDARDAGIASAPVLQRMAQQVELEGNVLENELEEYSVSQVRHLHQTTSRLRSLLAITEGLIIGFSVVFTVIAISAIRTTQKTVKCLLAMTNATREVAHGRLDVKVPVVFNDELGELAGSLNEMTESLAASLDEQNRAEQRLNLQAAALHAAANAILITQADGTIVWVNSAFTRLTGYEAAEAIGHKPSFLKSGRHPVSFYSDLWTTILSGNTWHSELVNRRKDGTLYSEEMTITPVQSDTGEITHFVAIKQDISARKQAEKTLRVSEERFALVAQATHDQIWDWEIGTGNMWRSAGYWSHFGYEPWAQEPPVSVWEKLVHPDDRERIWNEYLSALANRSRYYESEYRFKRGDGSYATVLDRGYVLYDDSGHASRVIGAMRDVSERRHFEEQLRQAHKLEAVGKLAGGIAHDFNNLLMIITSSAQLMELHIEGNTKAERDLGRILKAADRAAGLTQQLLAFGRKQVLTSKVLDLNAVVDETTVLLRRTIGEDIDLSFRGGTDVPTVLADPNQICQVVMNLCVNARDAMPRGGMLTVETRALIVDAHYARLHPGTVPGNYALLTVTDTGEGMTKEVQQRLFDPFFTTKELGKGTGLGLATVYGIVTQSGGYISVYSELGQGTTFRVLFPAAGSSTTPSQQDAPEVLAGGQTVMVVEDEETLRESIAEFLSAHGYKVVQACSGTEALRILESDAERIDVLLTDVVMPNMSGRELAETASAKWPAIRVVYMSGYTDDAIVRHGVLEANTTFVQKPFSLRDLGEKLRQPVN